MRSFRDPQTGAAQKGYDAIMSNIWQGHEGWLLNCVASAVPVVLFSAQNLDFSKDIIDELNKDAGKAAAAKKP